MSRIRSISRIKNKNSGIVHVRGRYVHPAFCGASPHSFIPLYDCHKVTCKSCLRLLKKKEKKERKVCKPLEQGKEIEILRKSLVDCVMSHAKTGGLNHGLKLDKKALEAVAHFIKNHANIFEGTTLNETISQALQKLNEIISQTFQTEGDETYPVFKGEKIC